MRGLLLVVCLFGSAALAQTRDPDTEAAQRHFEHGRTLYEEGRYDDALVEFETARKLKPLPELLYNIARTHERREAWSAAADAYQEYLREKPDSPDAAELRSRIDVLRSRGEPRAAVVQIAPPVAAAPPMRPLRGVAIGLAVGALVHVGLGGILVGTVGPDFHHLESVCSERQCHPSDWSSLQSRADAGYALLGLAGALAVVDLVLFVVDARHRPASTRARAATTQASVAPSGVWVAPSGLGLRGAF